MTRKKGIDPRITFGQAVAKLRRHKGLSQDELAGAASFRRSYIGDVELGTRNPTLLNMVKISRALEIPLSRVIGEMERAEEGKER